MPGFRQEKEKSRSMGSDFIFFMVYFLDSTFFAAML